MRFETKNNLKIKNAGNWFLKIQNIENCIEYGNNTCVYYNYLAI